MIISITQFHCTNLLSEPERKMPNEAVRWSGKTFLPLGCGVS
jgi:hypothetical protein